MRALVLTRYGGPQVAVLQEGVPVPTIAANELLIRVHAAGLNPVDYKIRDGQLRVIRRYRLPTVMGNDLAGVVESVGSEVTGFAVGDAVYASVGTDRMGALAEWTAVRADRVAKSPTTLSLETAAAVPLAALTALQALRDELGTGVGQEILITGGAGGVGTFAIQIAKHLGAHVATTASPRGEALVRRLGADVVIDYTRERFEQSLHGYDAALDLVGGDDLLRCFSVVKCGGTVLSIAGMPEPETARRDLGGGAGLAALFWAASFAIRRRAARYGVRYRYLFKHPSGADLAQIAGLIDSGQLEVVVDKMFPFAEVREALAYLEGGRAKGKVVVRMPGVASDVVVEGVQR